MRKGITDMAKDEASMTDRNFGALQLSIAVPQIGESSITQLEKERIVVFQRKEYGKE